MSYSQKAIDSEKKYCDFCSKQFTPNKYNRSQQKYCTDKECRKDRKKVSNANFRIRNPNYYKKSSKEIEENTYRTKVYDQQRLENRRIASLAKRVIKKQKRVIVDQTESFVSLLNFFFLTFLGMLSYSTGGLRQASAFSISNLLNLFYKDGVSIMCADANLKQKMEVLYEFITKSDQCFTVEELAEILQLD